MSEARGPGVFVCFEGGDGGGKSTQCRLLVERLSAEGFATLATFEPGDTAVGKELRRIVLDPSTGALAPRTEALLYAADKAEHVETVVLPALAAGTVVVTDRYVDSTLAYQGAGRGLGDAVAGLESLSRWATSELRPALTVVLDLDPVASARRIGTRATPDRIEAEAADFHARVREEFLRLAAADPERYLVVDATRDREEIAAEVWQRLRPLLADVPRESA